MGQQPKPCATVDGFACDYHSLLACAWAFHAATYQLSPKSFVMLEEDKVPAALLADLKGAEGAAFAT